jgi:hypothetical protein
MAEYQLPADGSVLIIDDKVEEALPLIQLLSQNGIASTFYTGTEDTKLPVQPVQKVRLAFIDIRLFVALDPNTCVQIVLRLLDRIIPDDNGPYILIVWSKHEDIYADELKAQVMSPSSKKPPVIFLSLQKAAYFDAVPEIDESLQERLEEAYSTLETRFNADDLTAIKNAVSGTIPVRGTWEPKADALQLISGKLKDELAKADAFHLFTIWENLVNKASGKTVASFSKLCQRDEYWKDNLKSGIYRMAHAQLGKKIVLVDGDELIRNALKTLNRSFLDILENDICEAKDLSGIIKVNRTAISFTKKVNNKKYTIKWAPKSGKYKLLIDGKKVGEKKYISKIPSCAPSPERATIGELVGEYVSISPEINTRLLIDFPTSKSIQPGNVYEREGIHWNRKRSIIRSYYPEKNDILGKNEDGQYKVPNSELKKFVFVELEVTPLCDYTQDNWLKSRLLPGVLIPEKYAENIDQSEATYGILPLIKINAQCYKPVFNFHLLKSKDIEKDPNKLIQPLFRIKKEVCADIRSRLSSHASRVGVTAVE